MYIKVEPKYLGKQRRFVETGEERECIVKKVKVHYIFLLKGPYGAM